jgi:hypothetical protein
MCQRNKIDPAATYQTVPLLNWMGQYFKGDEKNDDPLLLATKCLIEEGVAVDGDELTDALDGGAEGGDLPAVVKAYRNLPLLLQATEVQRYDLVMALVDARADITAAYPLADGSSSGITPLHVAMILSDPNEQTHPQIARFIKNDDVWHKKHPEFVTNNLLKVLLIDCTINRLYYE